MEHVGHTHSLVYLVSVEAVHASLLAPNKAFPGGASRPCRQPVTFYRNFHAEFQRQNAVEMKDFAFSWPKTDNVAELYPRKPLNRRPERQGWEEASVRRERGGGGQNKAGGEKDEQQRRRHGDNLTSSVKAEMKIHRQKISV